MPELPEVEVVVRGLNKYLIGQTVRAIEVRLPKLLNLPPTEFKNRLIGATIKRVERIGKMIVIHLNKSKILIFHLKMTGQLIFQNHQQTFLGGHTMRPLDKLPNKWTHLSLAFTKGTQLFFNDQRQFGYCHLISSQELSHYSAKYGLEPFGKFPLADFRALVARHPRLILKAFLLNQAYVAGLGNIYADEVAFATGLNPTTPLKNLTAAHITDLHHHIKRILKLAVAHNGTTFSNFLTADGQKGNFIDFLQVYGRGGTPCPRCGTNLRKDRVAGRGTVFCPQCQPARQK